MYKYIVFAFCGYFILIGANAQNTSFDGILNQVAQNNLELKAELELNKSKQLALKSANNLSNPEFGAYYMPFGEHTSGVYSEFEISQSFEFPSAYGARAVLLNFQTEQLQLEYDDLRQEILTEAKGYCFELVFLEKRLRTETLRVQQAKQVFEQVQQLFDEKQIGILDLNKAKVAWMQEQFNLQQIVNDKNSTLLLLAKLNGGNEIVFNESEYGSPLQLPTVDSLWNEKLAKDPKLVQLKQQEFIAQQSLKLAKIKALPDFTAGFNSQGIAGEWYSGFYGGISIPLWNNKNKVKSAQSHLDFKVTHSNSITIANRASFQKLYSDYEILLTKFQEYDKTLTGLNSDKLLLQAYELGEISFLEYYMELQFYRQAYDTMLEMQYQLYLLQTALLKHQL